MTYYMIGEKYLASYSSDEITLMNDRDFCNAIIIARKEINKFSAHFENKTDDLTGDDMKTFLYLQKELEKLKIGRDVDCNGQMKLFNKMA